MRLRACAFVLVALTALAATPRAFAAEPPSADRIKAAAEEFDRGRRSYLAKDFEQAAVHFENAYRDAPRAGTLRLAIRARREAGDLARAATLAALAQEAYVDDAPTAKLAEETLAEAGPRLSDLTVRCTPECAITADGHVVSQADAAEQRVFLEPGPHELGVSFRGGGSVARHVDAHAGEKVRLALEAPPETVAEPTPTGPRPKPGRPEEPESHAPLGPAVFFIAAGVTVAAGGATVVSGLDAQSHPGVDAVRAACAGKDESCPLYQEGRSAQLRTNILLGATIGAAVVTSVIGLFLTDWGGDDASASASRPAFTRLGLSAAPLPHGGAGVLRGTF